MADLLDLNSAAVRVVTGNTDRNGLTFLNVSMHDEPVRFMLFPHPLGTEVRQAPAPTRNEQRLDASFQLDAPRQAALARFEEVVRERTGFSGTWNYSVRCHGRYPTVKAKIILDGAKATKTILDDAKATRIKGGVPTVWPQMAFSSRCTLLTPPRTSAA